MKKYQTQAWCSVGAVNFELRFAYITDSHISRKKKKKLLIDKFKY